MTVCFDVYVTGGSIGSKLAGDAEESWYFFQQLVNDADDNYHTDVADHACGEDATKVAAFLRELADAIEKAA